MKYEIIICNNTDLLRVSAMDIMGIQAEGNYCNVILCDGEEKTVTFQMAQLEKMIVDQLGADATMLIRVGRSIMINIEYLYTISLPKQEISLRSPQGVKKTLSASKKALHALKDYVEQSVRKGGDE